MLGSDVGLDVGGEVGVVEGLKTLGNVGIVFGDRVGIIDGREVAGLLVIIVVGKEVAEDWEGDIVFGTDVGNEVPVKVGEPEGSLDGKRELGIPVGAVGLRVGERVGITVGRLEGGELGALKD